MDNRRGAKKKLYYRVGGEMELTDLEKTLLKELEQDSMIEECGATWTDYFLEDCSVPNKKARGVLSSLCQKNIIKMYTQGNESVIELSGKDRLLI